MSHSGIPAHAAEPVRITDRDPSSPLSAVFVPAAGMIGISLTDGDELLGQRRGLQAYLEAGKTMGIPFLHPWANRLSGDRYAVADTEVVLADGARGVRRDPGGLPIHGLLAAAPEWLVEPPIQPGGDARDELVAIYDFSGPELLASFPFPHEVEIAVTLESGHLTVRTTVVPTSDRPVPLAFGFHPYLTLPGVPRADWQLELPAMRHRPVDDRGIPTGEAELRPAEAFTLADRTYDDGFDGVAGGAAFVLAGGGRRITVTFDAGYPAAQLFAPPGEDVVCFEPMAAPTNALVSGDGLRFAEPGEPAVSVFSIAVEHTV